MPSSHLVALAAAGIGVLALAAPAAAEAREQHCVVEVVGQEADGELVLSSPECYRSFDRAAAAAGAPELADDALTPQAVAASSVIGVHYDGANFTGSSLTVYGTNCGGGYTNLTTTWRNRISSSLNGCPIVRFFDGANLTGASETQFASGNLFYLNNRADSIQYTS